MKKRYSLFSIITTIIITVAITVPLTLYLVGFDLPLLSSHYSFIKKISTIDTLVKTNYLFEVDEKSVYTNVINSYLSSLEDNYAFYFDPQQAKSNKNNLKGLKFGIGIDVVPHPETNEITVIYVNKQSPAFKAGLKKGDIISLINNESIKNKDYGDVINLMQGEVNETIKISVLRNSKLHHFSLKFQEFIVDSVRWTAINDIGYINITRFNEKTVSQFKEAIKKLQEKQVKGLIFDVRNNPGGVLDETAEILDMLVPKGDLINVKYKDGKVKSYAKSDKKEINLPMAVIINEHSASSAEVFALTLRDYNKAVIVGVKSFGKGIMQTTFNLSDKTAVKFTTGYIVNKNGDSHHEKGIEPDVKIDLSPQQKEYFYFLDLKEDIQIQHAISAIK